MDPRRARPKASITLTSCLLSGSITKLQRRVLTVSPSRRLTRPLSSAARGGTIRLDTAALHCMEAHWNGAPASEIGDEIYPSVSIHLAKRYGTAIALPDMYEKISDQLISTERFLQRLAKHALYVLGILALSILIGAAGFMIFEGYGLEDAILHSIHILSGLGLIEIPGSYAGRLFAALFGLYASLFFLAAFSVISAPVIHRILHKLHLENDD